MTRRALVLLALLALLAVTTAGCGSSAKRRTQVAPPVALSRMQLTSKAFRDQGRIPPVYTCDGDETPPPLAWSAPPAGTTELSLKVEDPDAARRPFVHWIVTGIPATTRALPPLPPSARQGTNSVGRDEFAGPCPPAGRPHHYVFTLQALAGAKVLAEGRLLGIYSR